MFINYIKITFRHLLQKPWYSFVNISSLVLGITAFLLIFIWVRDELGYDTHHDDADRIYRLVETQNYTGSDPLLVAVTPDPLVPYVKENFPGIIAAARFDKGYKMLLRRGEKRISEERCTFADPDFFAIFSTDIIRGTSQSLSAAGPDEIILTESVCRKLFDAAEDPIGEVINISPDRDVTVKAVIADPPRRTHLDYDVIMPFRALEIYYRHTLGDWGSNRYYSYIRIADNTDAANLDTQLRGVVRENNSGSATEIHMQPLKDIHLDAGFVADVAGLGDRKMVRNFMILGIFIFSVAVINFINLNTARSGTRARELGMRKVFGSGRRTIYGQYFTENLVQSLFAALFSLLLLISVLPMFNTLTAKEIPAAHLFTWDTAAVLILLTLTASIVSAVFPGTIYGSFQPGDLLKGRNPGSSRAVLLRRLLVIFQFSLAILFIIASLVVRKQLEFAGKYDTGINRDGIIVLNYTRSVHENFQAFRNTLLQVNGITAVSGSSELPVDLSSSTSGLEWEGRNDDENRIFHFMTVRPDIEKIFDLEMASGRFFRTENNEDTMTEIVINESAARVLGFEDPIGHVLHGWGSDMTIIGVVRDFHFKPIYEPIQPLLFFNLASGSANLLIRYRNSDSGEILRNIETVWKDFAPGHPFEYRFFDTAYNSLYRNDRQLGRMYGIFSVGGILISAMGLLGLVAFTVIRRRKEIAIRKSLGASMPTIMVLLSADMLKWILAANILAWPTAWLLLTKWLRTFAYRIDLNILCFLEAAVIAFLLALVSITLQVFKAARADPIEALKYE